MGPPWSRRAFTPNTARLSRFGLRYRLLGIGLLGVLMAVLIAQSALAGLGHVHRADRAVGMISHAQRLQQDADMMHDALRADVYNAVLVRRGDRSGTSDTVLADVENHAENLRRDLDGLRSVPLTGPAAQALKGLSEPLEAYAQAAIALVKAARVTTADTDLRAFDALFQRLVKAQAVVTSHLEIAAARTKEEADAAASSAQRQILLASAVALAVLLLLTVKLSRMGASLARLVSRQRSVAETLQRALLPDRLPDLPGLSLAARYVPGGTGVEVGGDWYDVMNLPSGAVALIMGDVVGHDLRAASVMGQMRNALRAYALEGLSPAAALGRLNHFVREIDPEEIATCVFAVFHPQASTLLIANAGHYPPLVVGPDRVPTFVDYGSCPPVGALESTVYTEKLYHLQPGATVLLYTDGLIERRDEDIVRGLARLSEAAAEGPVDVDQLCEHLLTRCLPTGAPADDVALLALGAQAVLGHELRLTLRAVPTELGPLRRTLDRWLQEAGANPDEAFELTVAVCEAATNAIEHAYGPDRATFDVLAQLTGRRVDVCVTDRGQWRRPRGRDRGRGLAVIDLFTDTMSVDSTATGTTVRMHRDLDRVRADELEHRAGAG